MVVLVSSPAHTLCTLLSYTMDKVTLLCTHYDVFTMISSSWCSNYYPSILLWKRSPTIIHKLIYGAGIKNPSCGYSAYSEDVMLYPLDVMVTYYEWS